jgi:hypothetical protein
VVIVTRLRDDMSRSDSGRDQEFSLYTTSSERALVFTHPLLHCTLEVCFPWEETDGPEVGNSSLVEYALNASRNRFHRV